MKNFTRIRKNAFRIAFAAVAVSTVLNTVVRADDVRQIHVRYDDLNIHTDAGASVLLQRIRVAAEQVCELSNPRELAQLAIVKACVDHALATAVDAVKRPALTRVYDDKFGITPSVTVVASR
jgi:UrcA family protein